MSYQSWKTTASLLPAFLQFCLVLTLIIASLEGASPAQAQSLRRSGASDGAAAIPRQNEPVLVTLSYYDEGEERESGPAGSGENGNGGKVGNFGSIVGAIEAVTRSVGNSGAGRGDGAPGATGRGPALARAVLRITPDYRMSGTADSPLVELMTEVELVSFGADPEIPPERLAALRAELGRSMARIRNDVPRLLTDKETATLLETGLLRLPLSDFRGESVFSHHALFDKPTTFLSLRPYAEARLRFVTLGEDGRIAVLRRLTPFQPFRVEVIYTARPGRAPGSVEVAVGRQRLRVALSAVPGDARLFRSDEILPLPDPSLEMEKAVEQDLADDPDHPDLGMPVLAGDPAAAEEETAEEAPEESAGEPVAETASATGGGGERITGLPPVTPAGPGRGAFDDALVNVAPELSTVPKPDPASPVPAPPAPPGGQGGPTGVAVAPAERDVGSLLPQQPRGGAYDPGSWRYIQPMTLAPEAVSPPDLMPELRLQEMAGRESGGDATAAAPAPRPPSSLRRKPSRQGGGPVITAGITDTRITVGAGGGRPRVSAPRQVASPLLRLLDMLGPEDPRLQPLLADGIQLSDEIAAQELLRELAAERAGATEGQP